MYVQYLAIVCIKIRVEKTNDEDNKIKNSSKEETKINNLNNNVEIREI
jgi:hypothetical protein